VRGKDQAEEGGTPAAPSGSWRFRAQRTTWRKREEKRIPSVNHLGRGIYAASAGSPDALKVAPDASGDHRTHAQSGL